MGTDAETKVKSDTNGDGLSLECLCSHSEDLGVTNQCEDEVTGTDV